MVGQTRGGEARRRPCGAGDECVEKHTSTELWYLCQGRDDKTLYRWTCSRLGFLPPST